MFDKIMYRILGAIDDFFSSIENFFTKKKKKKTRTLINKNEGD